MAPRARTTPFVRPGRGRGGRGGLVWKPNLLHLVHRSVYYDLFQYEYYRYVTHRTNIFTTTTTVRVLTRKHPCIDDFRKINKVRTCGTLVRTRAPRTRARVPFVFVLCSWFVCTNSVVYENPAASLQPLVARLLRSTFDVRRRRRRRASHDDDDEGRDDGTGRARHAGSFRETNHPCRREREIDHPGRGATRKESWVKKEGD